MRRRLLGRSGAAGAIGEPRQGRCGSPRVRSAAAGSRIVNVDPRPSSLHTVTSPPWLAQMCLTMARPSPVPPVARERARVDAVEALEDPGLLVRGDALALVGDGDLDHAVDGTTADGDPGAGVGVGDGVADEVADRGHQQVLVAEHLEVGRRTTRRSRSAWRRRRRGSSRSPRARLRSRRPAAARAGCRRPAAGTGRRSPGPAGSAGRSRPACGWRTAPPPPGRRWRRGPPRPAAPDRRRAS